MRGRNGGVSSPRSRVAGRRLRVSGGRGGTWTPLMIGVVALSGVSLVVAVVASRLYADVWQWSLVAYLMLLVTATGAIYWSRLQQLRLTRRAGRSGRFGIHGPERIALWAALLGCIANVVNIAIEVSNMEFWPTWLTELGQ